MSFDTFDKTKLKPNNDGEKRDKAINDLAGWGYGNTLSKVKIGCLHYSCGECSGTGVNRIGGSCVHYLSCPCEKCTVR